MADALALPAPQAATARRVRGRPGGLRRRPSNASPSSPGRSSPAWSAGSSGTTPGPTWPGSSPTWSGRTPSRSPTATTRSGTASSTSSAPPPGTTAPCCASWPARSGGAIGTPDGVIVFDPSGFPKKGDASVGVQRQWFGRLGKVDNGQVGVFMAYASRPRARPGRRPALPAQGVGQGPRRGGKRCGVPRAVRYRTRHELALEMLDETGPLLPHGWVTGDDEMGRSSRFRAELRRRGERYLLAVPSNTTVRDLDAEAPDVGRPRAAPEAGVRAGPGLGRVAAPGGVASDRGRRRREGPAGRASWSRRGWWPGRTGGGSGRRNCWWCSASRDEDGVTEARLLPVERPARDAAGRARAGGSRRAIGSRSACSGPRARRGWPTTRCGRGRGGTTTRRCR